MCFRKSHSTTKHPVGRRCLRVGHNAAWLCFWLLGFWSSQQRSMCKQGHRTRMWFDLLCALLNPQTHYPAPVSREEQEGESSPSLWPQNTSRRWWTVCRCLLLSLWFMMTLCCCLSQEWCQPRCDLLSLDPQALPISKQCLQRISLSALLMSGTARYGINRI